MATFKHISSKNADYGDAEKYLTFEHDEFTMKPTLDPEGRLIPRGDYRITSLNCGGEDFAVACMRANLRYGKNRQRGDVKSHHYIISFDPRDGPDNGLTVDRAQELGERFCREHFPGHQALVCTHPDGHNHSGNIHVHIVINSLRIEEVPLLPYMDRPADTRAGCKHRCTDAAMNYFRAEVMEMCHREGLYQIDLLNSSQNRVTEREYWAQKKGQAALDKQAAALAAEGKPTSPTKFETDKEKLRQTIRSALSSAASFEDFAALLLREGVTVKESRGRLSYLTPDRTKPITARKLGDAFDRAAILSTLEQNAARAMEQARAVPQYPRSIREQLQRAKAPKNAPGNDGLRRMVDIEAKKAEGKGAGYVNWATTHNLKNAARALALYQEYSNILLKLYLKSLKNGGRLQLDENIPYTAQMIATITRQQVGTVERALQIFMKLGLVEPLQNGALYMSNIELLIGQSSTEGERKRRARMALLEEKALPGAVADKCPPYRADICPPEIEIEKEIDIESEKERETEPGRPAPAAYGRYGNVFLSDTELSELQAELPGRWERYIERLSEYIASTGKKYRNHAATIRRWAADDTAKGVARRDIPDYSYREGESL